MSLLLNFALVLAAASGVPIGTVEDLGQPARARNILTGLVVRDRSSGRDTLVLSNNNEAAGAELIFLDFDQNVAQVFHSSSPAGFIGLSEVPGGRLALGAFYDGSITIFDLNRMQFVRSLQFPNQTYVWGFAMGSDGRAYCGTYPGARLGALDLSTYSLEDLGDGAPPNFYLRNVLAVPDGRILCQFMVQDAKWLVFDPNLKRFDGVPAPLSHVARIARWSRYIVGGQTVFDGESLQPVPDSLVFPGIRSVAAHVGRASGLRLSTWTYDTELTTPDSLYVSEGNELWRYDATLNHFLLVSAIDLHGGRYLGTTSDGRLVGARGEDYFVVSPGDQRVDLRTIPGDSSPRFIFFLKADPMGRIWGGPPYGQTLFWVDPIGRKTVDTPAISDHGGEVYDVAFLNGAAYAAAYSWGEVIRYDAGQPWDQWNQKNPKTILSLAEKGYGRPTGGIIVGPASKLYSGWTKSSGYGGAIAVTDPVTEASDLLPNPLGAQQITGLASDGTFLYVGTGLGATGLPTKPGESARFGIIDPKTKKVILQQEVPGVERIRVIGYDAATGIVPTIVDTQLKLFDTSIGAFVDHARDAPPVASWSNGLPGDGKLYYGSGKQVLSLDLRTGALQVLAETPGYVNNVTVAPDGTIYAGAWSDLYAIRIPASH